MKKVTLFFMLALIMLALPGFSKKIFIKVSNFQFSPSSVNAKVGDTIYWKWVSGTHTTTSLTIPAGAKTWDMPVDVNHKQFRYILKKKGVYNFECSIHASVMQGKLTVTAASAAGFDDFTLSEDDAQAFLNWKTVSSADVSYFSIQKSTDGNNFTEIAKVNANASNLYSFKDGSASGSKFLYYQIEMISVNGDRQLSAIHLFTNNHIAAAKLITSLSPNPVTSPGHLMLQFNAVKDGVMLARLYNQSGFVLKEEKLSAVKGLNNGHFHLGELAPGSYYIVFTLGDLTEKHTIIMK